MVRTLMALALTLGVLFTDLFSWKLFMGVPAIPHSGPGLMAARPTGCEPVIAEETLRTNLSEYPNSRVPQYGKLEISFDVNSTTATNLYFPYDPVPPSGVEDGTGMTVDALLLPPGEMNWDRAIRLPCFYYQPVEEVGSGENVGLLPTGKADWRCRFSPDVVGTWRFRVEATDACGTSETLTHQFDCATSSSRGFVRVSATDYRYFEFSDGTPFVTPLVNLEQGNPFNTLAEIRENIPKLGEHGVRFVRWFPNGEGANYFVAPYADTIRINWLFGDGRVKSDLVDAAAGKKFSFRPYYYSSQRVPVKAGERYRLSLVASISGERVLRGQIGNLSGGMMDVCSGSSTYHELQGDQCDYKQDGWHEYSIEAVSPGDTALSVAIRGLYVSSDAPVPYNDVQEGTIRTHSIRFQRYENGEWGANLLTRPDPDTYDFVDQRAAARLDEIMDLSAEHGVYHKLPLFHKNDAILNRLLPDGSVGEWDSLSRNFYSADGQASRWYQQAYVRYFVARWSYSPALHSLELANENHLTQESYEAGFALAEFVRNLSPRPILLSNSFWGWFVASFFADTDRGYLLDYGDKHWYANQEDTDQELISNTWDDSAAYVRECYRRFREYQEAFDYRKPIVRGEGGVAEAGTAPQHSGVAEEPQGIYYHKKLWAHVGVPGYTCDGDWYPRLFADYEEGRFPNRDTDLFKMFAAYERFTQGELLNSGDYEPVGTDLTDDEHIGVTSPVGQLRAWGPRQPERALLWIDNGQHTWKNVADGLPIASASASLTIPGFWPGKRYRLEWWDPYRYPPTEPVIAIESVVAQGDGSITIQVTGLDKDLAIKVVAVSGVTRVYLPLLSSSPSP